MATLAVGSVITIPFPYTDQKNFKVRPAIVLAKHGTNDFIICAVTSQNHSNVPTIVIESSDFSQGSLHRSPSFAHPSKIMTVHKSIILKNVAQLSKSKTSELLEAVRSLF